MDGLVLLTGRVPAGFPSPAADYMEERIDLNKYLMPNPSASFLIQVEGDSMQDAFIPDKAILLVDKSIKARHGHIVVAVLNGEFTVKRYVQTTAGIFLAPENEKYRPIQIKEGMEMTVWGVVRSVIINALQV